MKVVWWVAAQVLTGCEAGCVLEHAREMLRVIKTHHVRRFADVATAHFHLDGVRDIF